jgi:hypothetical protein
MGSSMARDDQSRIQDVTHEVPMTHREPTKRAQQHGGRKTLDEKGSQLPLLLPLVGIALAID